MLQSHVKRIELLVNVLKEKQIFVPQEMLDEIIADGKNNCGNKTVTHKISEQGYIREEID